MTPEKGGAHPAAAVGFEVLQCSVKVADHKVRLDDLVALKNSIDMSRHSLGLKRTPSVVTYILEKHAGEGEGVAPGGRRCWWCRASQRQLA